MIGRARWSYWYRASKMCGVMVREYRSLALAGSSVDSALRKETCSTLRSAGGGAGAGCAVAPKVSAARARARMK